METIFYLIPVAGLIGLLFAFIFAKRVTSAEPGDKRMNEIAQAIRKVPWLLSREYGRW